MGPYTKGIVAAIMAAAIIIQQATGIDFAALGLTEGMVTSLVGIIGALFVVLLPNTRNGVNVDPAARSGSTTLRAHWLATFIAIALAVILSACSGNLVTGQLGAPIAVPTGGCTVHFDGSWDCTIGGAGGPVPEAVVPVEVAPPPVVEAPAEPTPEPMTPEELNNLAPGQPPAS